MNTNCFDCGHAHQGSHCEHGAGGGYKAGQKCECVCGIYPDGSGPELAQEGCDLCEGTGRIVKACGCQTFVSEEE